MASPLYERTSGGGGHGSPPYHESALKAALRYIGYAGIGASAAQPGAGLGNLFLGAGAGFKASQAAQQAAQEYAMKQEQARQDAEFRDYQKLDIQSQIEARAKDKPPEPTLAQRIAEATAAGFTPEQIAQKEGYYIKPEKTGDKAETGLVQIDTPTGPKYVRPSQALGKSPPKKTPATKPASAVEMKNMGFYVEALDASKVIEKLQPKIQGMATQVKLRLPNFMQPQEMQRYNQAVRTIADAHLRQISGATVTQSEVENEARIYYVEPGDKPETIKQKWHGLQKLLETMKYKSGRAYKEYYEGAPAEEPIEGADPLEGFYAPQ
jgi:hypothetical protein